MTLAEWEDKHWSKALRYRDTEFRTVPILDQTAHRELFNLTDYTVTDVTGGSVWLKPKTTPEPTS